MGHLPTELGTGARNHLSEQLASLLILHFGVPALLALLCARLAVRGCLDEQSGSVALGAVHVVLRFLRAAARFFILADVEAAVS
jgi:hypothetical protein